VEGLGAGLSIEIRAAVDGDLEGIVALQCARNGDECDAPVRELFARPGVGPDRFAVAVDPRGRVVSSLCLLPESLSVGGVRFGAGQIEYVATAVDHEGQGLVRALMGLAHRWSDADGHLAQVIAGIPYFYRRFGYEYAVPFHRVWVLDGPSPRPSAPAGWRVRTAVAGDAERLRDLQLAAVEGVGVAALPGDVSWWRRRVSSGVESPWLVAVGDDDDDRIGAAATLGDGPPGFDDVTVVGAAVVTDDVAFDALLAAAASDAGDKAVAVQQRRAVDGVLAGRATLDPRQYSLYVRVADPLALLQRLRPALSERLLASAFASARGRLRLSLYRRTIVISYADGDVTAVEPDRSDDAHLPTIEVPPDLVATLLFGKHGATGLAERHEDVALRASAELADVLFPRLERDITLL
jgi:hypothetical protein